MVDNANKYNTKDTLPSITSSPQRCSRRNLIILLLHSFQLKRWHDFEDNYYLLRRSRHAGKSKWNWYEIITFCYSTRRIFKTFIFIPECCKSEPWTTGSRSKNTNHNAMPPLPSYNLIVSLIPAGSLGFDVFTAQTSRVTNFRTGRSIANRSEQLCAFECCSANRSHSEEKLFLQHQKIKS